MLRVLTQHRVPVDSQGLVDAESVISAIRADTALVTLMHSNNEVGSIQPVRQIAEHCASLGVCMHSDAAQSVGKVPVTLGALGPVHVLCPHS